MEIERVNCYDDPRFDQEVLLEHGAFLVDGAHPCQFRITGPDSAVMHWRGEGIDELIEAFRFYAEHITRFYDPAGRLLRQLPAVEAFSLPIVRIQPSQFYADREKVRAAGTFIHSGEDVAIPVLAIPGEDRFISCDGHSRLCCADRRGYRQVRAFLTEDHPYIWEFVQEARKRGIFSVADIRELPHEEYARKWNGFCDSFFARKEPG